MQSNNNFPLGINFNFAVDNLLVNQNQVKRGSFPPVSGAMGYENNTDMVYEDGALMLYE